jgi:protein-S-isoprenylcysteine O-methyltransferase Ste14
VKDFKETLGLYLAVFGALTFVLFIVTAGVNRFAHPELTETQLMLWSLERWWGWVPALAAIGLGLWLNKDRAL